jgi:hypothetical protein
VGALEDLLGGRHAGLPIGGTGSREMVRREAPPADPAAHKTASLSVRVSGGPSSREYYRAARHPHRARLVLIIAWVTAWGGGSPNGPVLPPRNAAISPRTRSYQATPQKHAGSVGMVAASLTHIILGSCRWKTAPSAVPCSRNETARYRHLPPRNAAIIPSDRSHQATPQNHLGAWGGWPRASLTSSLIDGEEIRLPAPLRDGDGLRGEWGPAGTAFLGR